MRRWAMVMLLLASVAAGCGGSGLPVPAEVRGEWTTADPRYEGRALHIGPDSVRFYTGGGAFTSHAVRTVEIERGAGGATYRLSYDTAGGAYLLSFRLTPEETIVLLNQPGPTWRRTGEGGG